MPDTYTSQFSGEEIDAALRAAQIISGASTLAELRKKLEIRGDTIPVSATDPTPISEALTTSGGGINPNLLDNWYFGNPVNQRSGYYIPAGVKYNTLSWTEAGTTDKAYPVIGYSGQDPLITVNGTNYIVGKSAQVPGYCAAGYTVDRWWVENGMTLRLTNDGVVLESAGTDWWAGLLEKKECSIPAQTTITFSVLGKFTGSPRLFLGTSGNDEVKSYYFSPSGDWECVSVTATLESAANLLAVRVTPDTKSVKANCTLLAAKLELGDTQTLAHKENGVWVLNEVPDYGEQLRRCQRHAFSPLYEAYATAVICNLFVSSVANGVAFGEVTLPVSMRNKPVFSGNASKFWIVAENGGGASHPTAISVMGLSADKVMIQVNGSYTANTQYILYVENPFTSADFLLSADL